MVLGSLLGPEAAPWTPGGGERPVPDPPPSRRSRFRPGNCRLAGERRRDCERSPSSMPPRTDRTAGLAKRRALGCRTVGAVCLCGGTVVVDRPSRPRVRARGISVSAGLGSAIRAEQVAQRCSPNANQGANTDHGQRKPPLADSAVPSGPVDAELGQGLLSRDAGSVLWSGMGPHHATATAAARLASARARMVRTATRLRPSASAISAVL